jgi:predicted GNAT family N-acyltransferase/ADP-ribose pyrophosphatase YjhB (NUDIX family)
MSAGAVWACGPWRELAGPASAVRREVFVEEMGVPEALDFDGTDDDSRHLVVSIDGRPAGTGRVRPIESRIGRVAVRREHRGRGLGREIVARLVRETIRLGLPEVCLHAQEHAVGFYEALGFTAEGERFFEADIPHRFMRRALVWREAAAALILRDGRLLLGRRAPRDLMGGLWDLFGGKLEPGEGACEALRRELREELAIEATLAPLLDVCLYDDPRDGSIFRSPVFRVNEFAGEIVLNPEHTEARWFTPDEVASLALAHPDIPALFTRALAERTSAT